MSEEDPRRLRQGPDTPEELLRALAALRKGVDEGARLERVAQKLGPFLDAPPSAAASAGAAGHKLGALKLIVGGLTLLAPLLYWQLSQEGSTAPLPAGSSAGAEAPALVSPVELVDDDATAVVPSPSVDVPSSRPETGPTQPPSSKTSRARPAPPRRNSGLRSTAARSQASRSAQTAPSTPSAESGDAVASRGGTSEQRTTQGPTQGAPGAAEKAVHNDNTAVAIEQHEQRDDPTARQPKPKPSSETLPTAPALPSEAELLFSARKAMKADAEAALRTLAQHASLYPKGRLVPEREVLTIEALRSLGRTQEAELRLRHFQARYPNSIHLKRLLRQK